MAKGPFHFKAFSVEQDGAAMKVGTDGIVLGCWTPIRDAELIMDAGAGNGYVGIMLLQRALNAPTLIGVELEAAAAKQCAANYASQPFEATTQAWNGSLQTAAAPDSPWIGCVDLIVSNPPFFRNKPKSPIPARNLARHDDTMPMGAVVQAAWNLLKPGGRLCTIWPMDRKTEWEEWGRGMGFVPVQHIAVHTMRHLPPKRLLTEWQKPDPAAEPITAAQPQGTLTLEGKATLDFTPEYLEIVSPYLRGT